jgi:hypothetical protein
MYRCTEKKRISGVGSNPKDICSILLYITSFLNGNSKRKMTNQHVLHQHVSGKVNNVVTNMKCGILKEIEMR